MHRHNIKVCIMRMEGTNCEDEAARAFIEHGVHAEKVHLKQLTGECPHHMKRELASYNALFLPGGWSAGDCVRAGAIFAARIKSRLMPQLRTFIDDGKPVMGVCNGFQILVELGILPGFNGISPIPEAVLLNNTSGFQCRHVFVKKVKHKDSIFTSTIPRNTVLTIPIAHAEGRLTFRQEEKDKMILKLIDNDQIMFRYCMEDGGETGGRFPYNPNGAMYDIAGITNPAGNALGMMPHPERVTSRLLHHNWPLVDRLDLPGDGKAMFESVVNHIAKKW